MGQCLKTFKVLATIFEDDLQGIVGKPVELILTLPQTVYVCFGEASRTT